MMHAASCWVFATKYRHEDPIFYTLGSTSLESYDRGLDSDYEQKPQQGKARE